MFQIKQSLSPLCVLVRNFSELLSYWLLEWTTHRLPGGEAKPSLCHWYSMLQDFSGLCVIKLDEDTVSTVLLCPQIQLKVTWPAWVGVFRLLGPRAAQPLFLNWWNNKKIFFDWKKGQPVMPSLSLGKFAAQPPALQSIWSELGGNTKHDLEFLRRLQLDLRTKAKSYELRTEISSD